MAKKKRKKAKLSDELFYVNEECRDSLLLISDDDLPPDNWSLDDLDMAQCQDMDLIPEECEFFGESQEEVCPAPAPKREEKPQATESGKESKSMTPHMVAQELIKNHCIILIDENPYCYDPNYRFFRPLRGAAGDRLIRERLSENAKNFVYINTTAEVTRWLTAEQEIPKIKSDDNTDSKTWVNFRNATIYIDSLEPCYPGDYACFRRYINADFPYDRIVESVLFEDFLVRTFGGDYSAISLLQEIFGYLLSDIRDVKKAFLFFGPSNSGKSVVGNLLRLLTGDEFTSTLAFSDLNSRFGPSQLFGKFLNVGSEMDTASRISGSIFKRLVGNDMITAEEKYCPPFQFVNSAAMVFLSNSFPKFDLGEDAASIEERLIIVPFLNSVPREEWIPQLDKELYKEAEYIVAWAMRGLQRLIRNNFVFSRCRTSEGLLNAYITSAFPEQAFVKQCLVADPDGTVSTEELNVCYRYFCEEHEILPTEHNRWHSEILKQIPVRKTRGINYNGGKNLRGYRGISMRREE